MRVRGTPIGRGRLVLAIAGIGVLATVAGVVAFRSGGRSAEEPVQAIRRFVSQAGTVHFLSESERDGFRTRTEGDLELPDRGRWITETIAETDETAGRTEYLAVPGGAYARSADDGDELENRRFIFLPRSEAKLFVFDQVAAGLTWLGSSGLEDMLSKLEALEYASPQVVRGTLPLSGRLTSALDRSALEGKATVELTVDPTGRLERLEWRAEVVPQKTKGSVGDVPSTTVAESTVVVFSRWGEPVELVGPAVEDLELTPTIDEEELARFDAFGLLAPRSMPEGFELTSATVMTPIDAEALGVEAVAGSCPAVVLEWSRPPATSVSLEEKSANCDSGAQTLQGEGNHQIQRIVQGVLVTARGNLPAAELERFLDDLGPLDLARQTIRERRP